MSRLDTFGATKAVVISASDSADLSDGACRAIAIGTGGVVRLTLADNFDGTYAEFTLAAGIHPLQAKRVWSTSLTAAGLVALY